MPRNRFRRVLFPVLSVLLAVLSVFLLLEAGLRAAAVHRNWATRRELARLDSPAATQGVDNVWMGRMIRRTANAKIIYALRPHLDLRFFGKAVRTGPNGFRREPATVKKEPGVARIVGLGDSEMFGWGVGEEENYLARLENYLNRTYPAVRWEVVNTAVPGYNAVMEVETLKERGLQYEPDLVIMHYVVNDRDLPNFLSSQDNPWDLRRSYAAEFISRRIHGVETRAKPGLVDAPPHPLYKNAFENNPAKVPPAYRGMVGDEAYGRAMRTLARLANERSFRPFIFSYFKAEPAVSAAWEKAGLPHVVAEDTALVRAYMRDHGLRKFQGSTLALSKEDPHPSAIGHKLIFRVLAQALEESGVIDEMVRRRGPEDPGSAD